MPLAGSICSRLLSKCWWGCHHLEARLGRDSRPRGCCWIQFLVELLHWRFSSLLVGGRSRPAVPGHVGLARAAHNVVAVCTQAGTPSRVTQSWIEVTLFCWKQVTKGHLGKVSKGHLGKGALGYARGGVPKGTRTDQEVGFTGSHFSHCSTPLIPILF